MAKTGCHFFIPLALLCMILCGCSAGEESPAPAKVSERAATKQAAEAIKEYGKRPINKARAAQRMGEERTVAIDEAVKGQ